MCVACRNKLERTRSNAATGQRTAQLQTSNRMLRIKVPNELHPPAYSTPGNRVHSVWLLAVIPIGNVCTKIAHPTLAA
jgi:hypothetical protein